MRLISYIKQNGFNIKSFAREIGTSHRNMEMWARGERMPRWKEAEKIFIYTNNAVTGHDLYEEQIQRKKANI